MMCADDHEEVIFLLDRYLSGIDMVIHIRADLSLPSAIRHPRELSTPAPPSPRFVFVSPPPFLSIHTGRAAAKGSPELLRATGSQSNSGRFSKNSIFAICGGRKSTIL